MAAIAQLGERQTEDLKVPGSIPGLGICFDRYGSVQHGRTSRLSYHARVTLWKRPRWGNAPVIKIGWIIGGLIGFGQIVLFVFKYQCFRLLFAFVFCQLKFNKLQCSNFVLCVCGW